MITLSEVRGRNIAGDTGDVQGTPLQVTAEIYRAEAPGDLGTVTLTLDEGTAATVLHAVRIERAAAERLHRETGGVGGHYRSTALRLQLVEEACEAERTRVDGPAVTYDLD